MSRDIVYSTILLERAAQVSEFLLNSFFKDEPLGIALGLPLSQVSRWLPSYIEKAVDQNVSVMAVDPETNKIVGVSVNMIESRDGPNLNMAEFLDPVQEPIMTSVTKFFRKLHTGVETPNKPPKILVLGFLNVDSDYGGKGIGQELTLKSEKLGLELGIDSVQVSTTSEFSYKVYKKLGFSTLREEEFSEYESNGGSKILNGIDMGIHQRVRILYKILH